MTWAWRVVGVVSTGRCLVIAIRVVPTITPVLSPVCVPWAASFPFLPPPLLLPPVLPLLPFVAAVPAAITAAVHALHIGGLTLLAFFHWLALYSDFFLGSLHDTHPFSLSSFPLWPPQSAGALGATTFTAVTRLSLLLPPLSPLPLWPRRWPPWHLWLRVPPLPRLPPAALLILPAPRPPPPSASALFSLLSRVPSPSSPPLLPPFMPPCLLRGASLAPETFVEMICRKETLQLPCPDRSP